MQTRNQLIALSIATAAVLVVASPALATVETFDNAITLGSTQAAGTWYTDRYAPAGFQSGVFFDGGNRLKQTISAADGANSRPGGYSGSFYNTQGRKYDLDAGTTSMSIDLYIDASWATSGRRMAGIWGTAFDGANSVSGYPIIEFMSDGSTGGFRAYNTTDGSWHSLGLPTGFLYGTWATLDIQLVAGNWQYTVGDTSWSVDAEGSVSIGNVILQGHNTTDGVDYDIYWDNFGTAVPAPGALALLGCAGLVGARRRRA